MGTVIDLVAWRRRQPEAGRAGSPARPNGREDGRQDGRDERVPRLDVAVARLERLMRAGTGRISARVETELLAITGAVTAGRMDEAARRAERLAERLEHPSSSLAR
jgi:hypothetical protein